MSTLQGVLDQMTEAGLAGLTAADLIVDGRVHRFRPEGHRQKTAWYILFSFRTDSGDDLITGKFGDWRWGDGGVKVSIKGAELSSAERAKLLKQQREKAAVAKADRERQAHRAAGRARSVWARLSITGHSAYLARKRVHGYGVRYSRKGAVAIPMRNVHGVLQGLQIIHAEPRRTRDGDLIEKDFWPFGVDPKGAFCRIGPEPGPDEPIVLCEGYATGASIHEASGFTVFAAFTAGNLRPAALAVRELHPRNPFIVAGDDDYLTKDNPGEIKAKEVAEAVNGLAIAPRFAAREHGIKWTDFNDLHVHEGLAAVREQIQAAAKHPTFQDWRVRLTRTGGGAVKPEVGNVALVLEHDTDWRAVLGYCDFSYRTMKRKTPPFDDSGEPGEWTDADTARLRIWLSTRYGFTPRASDVDDAVLVVAQRQRFHPVREYLEGLIWDGEERLTHWLIDGLGVKADVYSQAVAVKWMVGAVARVMKPPVKMDAVLILEGPQGLGKSSAMAVLGGAWFSDTHFALGEKDGYQQMQGVWICELSELDSFNKAETTRAKSFFSSEKDRYRVSYGRRVQDFPRQCVFVGTTNQESYLKDVTGNRRYWPILCTDISLDWLRDNRDQLWAEALVRFRKKTYWWVLPDELTLFEGEQDQRFQEDAWESLIGAWLNEVGQKLTEQFSAADVMYGALKLEPHQMKPPEQIRVGLIMARLNWKKRRLWNGGQRLHVYERPRASRLQQRLIESQTSTRD